MRGDEGGGWDSPVLVLVSLLQDICDLYYQIPRVLSGLSC